METKPITKQDKTEKPLRFYVRDGTPVLHHDGKPIHDYNCSQALRFATGHPERYEDKCDCMTDTPTRFVAIENRVHDNLRRLVCRARSGNMAARIANALNKYRPDKRGQ